VSIVKQRLLYKSKIDVSASESNVGISSDKPRQSAYHLSHDNGVEFDPQFKIFLSVYNNIPTEVYGADFVAVDVNNIVSRDAHIINLMFLLDDLYWLQVLKNRGSQLNEGSRFIKLLILQSVKLGKVEKFYSSFKLLSISDRILDECSDSEYLNDLSEQKLDKFSWIAPALVTVIKTCDLPMDATICQITSLVLRILNFSQINVNPSYLQTLLEVMNLILSLILSY